MRINVMGSEGGTTSNFIITIEGGHVLIYSWLRLFPLWTVKFYKTGPQIMRLYREGLSIMIFIGLPRFWKSRIQFRKFCWSEIDKRAFQEVVPF